MPGGGAAGVELPPSFPGEPPFGKGPSVPPGPLPESGRVRTSPTGTYLREGTYARTLRISPPGSPLRSRDPRPQPSGPPWGTGEWVPGTHRAERGPSPASPHSREPAGVWHPLSRVGGGGPSPLGGEGEHRGHGIPSRPAEEFPMDRWGRKGPRANLTRDPRHLGLCGLAYINPLRLGSVEWMPVRASRREIWFGERTLPTVPVMDPRDTGSSCLLCGPRQPGSLGVGRQSGEGKSGIPSGDGFRELP